MTYVPFYFYFIHIYTHRIKKADDSLVNAISPGAVFSYKLRYIVGFWLVEMAISTNK